MRGAEHVDKQPIRLPVFRPLHIMRELEGTLDFDAGYRSAFPVQQVNPCDLGRGGGTGGYQRQQYSNV